MKLETGKGMKDYGPEEKMLRDSVVNTLKEIFELYGFNSLETPIMEKWEVLSAKYAGGSEILKETYKLKDQGNRDYGLRYDLTVPLARYIGMNPTVKTPFKRYQVGQVFRDGPVKKGRLRQFWQADVDIVGTDSLLADAELLKLTLDAFDRLGLPVDIKVNNRKLLNSMIGKAGIKKAEDAIIALDKLEKIGRDDVLKEMQKRGIKEQAAYKLLDMVDEIAGKDTVFLKEEFPGEGSDEIMILLETVGDERIKFTPSLARGLAYYTGSIFEVFTEGFDSSIAAGGRYDNMIGEMTGRKFPAVGISFGIEPICGILKGKAEPGSIAKVLVIPIGVRKEAEEAVVLLRKAGINTDIDVTGRGVSKNLDYANSYNIPYCLMIGEKEVKSGKYTLKDMKSGKEEKLELKEIKKKIN